MDSLVVVSRRIEQLIVCLIAVALVTKVGNSAAETGRCQDSEKYMKNETIVTMKSIKVQFATCVLMEGSPRVVPIVDADFVCPCLVGVLLLDLRTAKYIESSVADNLLQCIGQQQHVRRKRALFFNFTSQTDHMWPTSIPYTYNFTDVNIVPDRTVIPAALHYVQQQTCVRFTPAHDLRSSFLSFVSGSSCTTFYGRSTDTVNTDVFLTPSCTQQFGIIIYNLAATLGLLNENVRIDRSQWIYINSSNINPFDAGDFASIPGFIISSEYDYASISHASASEFAVSSGYTVLPWDPLYLHVIGQRVEWSFLDIKAINTFYCNGTCHNTLNCQHGGYVDPNNCLICKCPDGYAGGLCDQLSPPANAACGPTQDLTATFTDNYLTSPNYPQSYSSFSSCTWKITAGSPGYKILVKFVDSFGLYEAPSAACYHWVEIRYKILDKTGPRFCGSQLPISSLVTEVGAQVLVLFRSKFNTTSATNSGFRLLYKLISCEPSWSPFVVNDSNSVGGSLVAGFLTESGCRDYCAYDRLDCVAVDIDRNAVPYPLCWIHTNAADLQLTFYSPGVVQYRLLKGQCPTVPSCTPTFESENDTNSLGGEIQSSAQTVAECRLSCASNALCVAVDWDSNTATCWFHTNADDLNHKYTTRGVTQYRVTTRCSTFVPTTSTTTTTTPTTTTTTTTTTSTTPTTTTTTSTTTIPTTTTTPPSTQRTTSATCLPYWNIFMDTKSNGAIYCPGSTSLVSCQWSCIVNEQCVALEWDTQLTVCWIHVNAADLSHQYLSVGMNQYQITRCGVVTPARTSFPVPPTTVPQTSTSAASCSPSWQVLFNTRSVGALLQSWLTTLPDCQLACSSNIACVAVDWDWNVSPPNCWMHLDRNNLKQIYSASGITQFRLVVRCNTIPVSSTPPATTTTTPTTTTTSTPTPTTTPTTTTPTTTTSTTTTTTVPVSGCVPQWIERVNVNSVGASRDSSLTSVDQCRAACSANPSCVAVEWDSTSTASYGCWVHTNINDLSRHFTAQGVTQYEFVTHCTTSATTTAKPVTCQPTWIVRNQTHSVGATLVVDPISAADCLNRCAISSSCVAVDMVISCSPPQCWIHTNTANLNTKYRDVNSVQYELVTRCVTVEPPPPDVCGGQSTTPGQVCQPCSTPVSPARTCTVQRWQTSNVNGIPYTQLVNIQVPCTIPSCQPGAILATVRGVQSCVWTGWSQWTSCGFPCYGQQHRYYWSFSTGFYAVNQHDERTCPCT